MSIDPIIDKYAYLLELSSLSETIKDHLIEELQEKGITEETKKKIIEALEETKNKGTGQCPI